jgi:hypothetical protein
MSNRKDPGLDPRIFTGTPSVKSRLYRKYNAALESGAPIDPTLDELLFGSNIDNDEPYYELPLLKRATQKEREGARDTWSGRAPASLGAVDSMSPTKHAPSDLTGCPISMGGYDGGFESGFQGNWNSVLFQGLIDKFEQCRQPGKSCVIEVGGREFELKPHGAGGGDSVHYRYVIEGGGWKVYFHHDIDTGFQPIRVRFGFESLCGRSLFDVHADFMLWLYRLGFHVTGEKISRADLQIMTTRPIIDYVRPVAHEHVVMRAKDGVFHLDCRRPSSFNFGTKIRIRAYDKKRQLLDKCDEFGMKMIAEYCCGGVIPDHLSRIEFQVSRDVLNAMEINTIEDLRNSELSLVEWLTFDWFRIVDGPIKKGHSREQKIADVWQEVREEFRKYFPGGNNNRTVTRYSSSVKDLKCTSEDLVKQAVGCLATMVSRTKGVVLEGSAILSYIVNRIQEFSDDLISKSVERTKKFSVLKGYDDIDDHGSKSYDPRYAMNPSCLAGIRNFGGGCPSGGGGL